MDAEWNRRFSEREQSVEEPLQRRGVAAIQVDQDLWRPSPGSRLACTRVSECVCVCERERERRRRKKSFKNATSALSRNLRRGLPQERERERERERENPSKRRHERDDHPEDCAEDLAPTYRYAIYKFVE